MLVDNRFCRTESLPHVPKLLFLLRMVLLAIAETTFRGQFIWGSLQAITQTTILVR